MRKNLIVILAIGMVVGLFSTGFADENITILANERSGSDHIIGEYRLVTPGTYNISIVDGAWGTFALTDFDPPNATNTFGDNAIFVPYQGWLWSMVIFNGTDSVMLGDHSLGGAFNYDVSLGNKAAAQASALSHNGVGTSVPIESKGELWFYIYDPGIRDAEGSLTFNVAVVPEPISTTLFIVGGVLLGGRSYLRRKKS